MCNILRAEASVKQKGETGFAKDTTNALSGFVNSKCLSQGTCVREYPV